MSTAESQRILAQVEICRVKDKGTSRAQMSMYYVRPDCGRRKSGLRARSKSEVVVIILLASLQTPPDQSSNGRQAFLRPGKACYEYLHCSSPVHSVAIAMKKLLRINRQSRGLDML